jgi:hypothetical protein
MTVSDIKAKFRDRALHIGGRDCKVLGTAAITG